MRQLATPLRAVATAALLLLLSYLLTACGGHDEPAPAPVRSPAPGHQAQHVHRVVTGRVPSYSFVLPQGWERHSIGNALDYSPLVLLSSFDSHRRWADPCRKASGLGTAEPGSAEIWIFAYGRENGRGNEDFPPRPARFHLGAEPLRSYECTGHGYLLTFREGGWKVQAQIGIRGGPSPATLDGVETILNSLSVSGGHRNGELHKNRAPFLG